jgi:hypothetical protein
MVGNRIEGDILRGSGKADVHAEFDPMRIGRATAVQKLTFLHVCCRSLFRMLDGNQGVMHRIDCIARFADMFASFLNAIWLLPNNLNENLCATQVFHTLWRRAVLMSYCILHYSGEFQMLSGCWEMLNSMFLRVRSL